MFARSLPVSAPIPLRLAEKTVGEIVGYVAIWGTPLKRDSYDTWFDKSQPPEMGLDFLPFPLAYEHGYDPVVGKAVVGRVTEIWIDDIGIGYRALLDTGHPQFSRFVEELERGILFTSSGSSEHMAEFDSDGRFVRWLLTEISMTQHPAEPHMPVLKLVRSAGRRDASKNTTTSGNVILRIEDAMKPKLYTASGKALTRDQAKSELVAQRSVYNAEGTELSAEEAIATLLQDGMSIEDIAAILQQLAPAEEEPPEEELSDEEERSDDAANSSDSGTALLEQIAALVAARTQKTKKPTRANGDNAALAAMQRDLAAMRREQQRRDAAPPANYQPTKQPAPAPAADNVRVADKYGHLTLDEMLLGYTTMKQARIRSGGNIPVSDAYMKAMAIKAALAQQTGDKAANDPVVRSKFNLRTDEVMQTDLAGYGDEWVYDMQGTALWEKIRMETPIHDLLKSKGMEEREIPAGHAGDTIQLEGADGTWYTGGEGADYNAASGAITPVVNPTKTGTEKLTVTIGKLSYKQFISEELVEDSIITMVPEINRKIQVTAREQLEIIELNGDTDVDANENINLIDSTPAAAPGKPAYMTIDGLLKQYLVTNAAMGIDALNTIDETLFLRLLSKMTPRHRQDMRNRLVFIMDAYSALVLMNVPSVKTRDVYSAATQENGMVTAMWTVPVATSGFIELANTAGKISATGGNNTRGRIALVRADQVAFRWKRRLKTDLFYDGGSDTHRFTAHMRFGMKVRDANAVAGAYNVKAAF